MSLTFEDACEMVRDRTSDSMSKSDQRLLYVYYKVATAGPTPNVPRPSSLSPKCPYWDA